MTREEATAYIQARPATFGTDVGRVLGQVQSSTDPNFYDPTLYVPEQGKTVIKPSVKAKAAVKSAAASLTPPKTGKPLPSVSVLLALALLGLGAGMTLYKVSR